MPMKKSYKLDDYGRSVYPEPAQRAIENASADKKKVELEESQFSDPEEYDWSQVRINDVPVPGTWRKGY